MSSAGADVPLLWILTLTIPWLSAVVLILLPSSMDRYAKALGLTGSLLGAVAVSLSVLMHPPPTYPQIIVDFPWVSDLGLDFVVIRDGLSTMFVLVAAWISVLVTTFAWTYLPTANHHEGAERLEKDFYAPMSAFTGAMICALTSGNLLQLYLFWELTGIVSYLLIGYWENLPEARKGAFLALGLTVAGGVLMLAGFFLIGIKTGEWSLGGLSQAKSSIMGSAWLEWAALLVIVGALAKSAQFPFMAWLPAAMAAPTPVSAFLHSSSLVALGVYLLARLYPLLGASLLWKWSLFGTATISAVYAGFLAVRQDRIKALLAYSTVSQYSFMFIGFSLRTWFGVRAALYAYFVHAFIKAGLFLVAGSVTHLTGHKEFDKVGRIATSNSVLTLYAAILGLSLAGVPVLAGFFYKEEILKAALYIESWFLYGVVLIASVLSFAYTARFMWDIFLAPPEPDHSDRLPLPMAIPIAILALVVLLTSFVPDWMAPILNSAVVSSTGMIGSFETKVEISPVFWSSLAAAGAGFLVWLLWHFSERARASSFWIPYVLSLPASAAGRLYSWLSECFLRLHTGDLRFYLRWMLALFLVLTALVWSARPFSFPQPATPIDYRIAVLLLAVVLTAGTTILVVHHITFTLVLTLVGYGLSATFLLMGAPNVALAQVLVETLITLSIILALRESFRIDPDSTKMLGEKSTDLPRWFISCGMGTVMGIMTYLAVQSSPRDVVGQWYPVEGFTKTGVKDFVSAILTDFRGLDTMVEISVFATSILAIIGLYWHERISDG